MERKRLPNEQQLPYQELWEQLKQAIAKRNHAEKLAAALETRLLNLEEGVIAEGWCEQPNYRWVKEPGGWVMRIAVWYQCVRPDAKRVTVREP